MNIRTGIGEYSHLNRRIFALLDNSANIFVESVFNKASVNMVNKLGFRRRRHSAKTSFRVVRKYWMLAQLLMYLLACLPSRRGDRRSVYSGVDLIRDAEHFNLFCRKNRRQLLCIKSTRK